jgi:hypothetical protein
VEQELRTIQEYSSSALVFIGVHFAQS